MKAGAGGNDFDGAIHPGRANVTASRDQPLNQV
jgi:hypothetical protein